MRSGAETGYAAMYACCHVGRDVPPCVLMRHFISLDDGRTTQELIGCAKTMNAP
jgi:hypothetical protein